MMIKNNLKKIISFLLVISMILTMSITVFADQNGDSSETPTPTTGITGIYGEDTGSITINKITESGTYKVYRLLDLQSFDTGKKTYSYTVNNDWAGFFATEEALEYVTISANNTTNDGDNGEGTENGSGENNNVIADNGLRYVSWKEGVADSAAEDFAKLALAYAKANGIAPIQSSETEGKFVITTDSQTGITSGKFSDLELGYYLVDSTVGALCGLTTTNLNASINAKNIAPTMEKQVQEDATNQWGITNSADIGQTVYFRVTINVHDGAENYILHDKMAEGLTFQGVTRIEHVIPTTNTTTEVPETYYTVATGSNVTEKATDETTPCTFEVKFNQEFCDHVQTTDKIIVYYQAMLNRNAEIAGVGNHNEAWLEFGEGNNTTSDSTDTFTYGFDIVKTDSQNTLLNGAKFRIYDAPTGGNEVKVVLTDSGMAYRRARTDEEGIEIEVVNGQARLVGFDNGIYYLEETVAPSGFNKLSNRQKITISDAILEAVFNDGVYSTGSGVHVVNKAGQILPETGGIGTTIFYIIGGLMVFGAVVLMVTKKRMDSND